MSTLVVFFSLEGNTRFIAEQIADTLHADRIELTAKKEYPKKGFMKYFWGGKSVVFGEEPELCNGQIDLSSYETIIIGTPVWAGSFAPPVKTFLTQYKIENKKIALFACHGGGGASKCFQKIKEAIPSNEWLGEIAFVDPAKKDSNENSNKAVKWAESLPI